MEQENRDDKEIRDDLTKALRLIDRWSYDTSQNSIVFDKLFYISASLKTVLESIGYTQQEIDNEREAEEIENHEQEELDYENEIYELKNYIDEIIEKLTQNKIKHLAYGDSKNIAYAIGLSLRNKDLSEEILKSILPLLRFCSKCL